MAILVNSFKRMAVSRPSLPLEPTQGQYKGFIPPVGLMGIGVAHDRFERQAPKNDVALCPRDTSQIYFGQKPKPNTLRANGYLIQKDLYEDALQRYRGEVYAVAQDWDSKDWGAAYPFIEKLYETIQCPGWVGIPPCAAFMDQGVVKNTHGALAALLIRMLQDPRLSPAHTAEEGLAKLEASLYEVTFRGTQSLTRLVNQKPSLRRNLWPSKGVTITNLWIKPLQGTKISMIFNRHIWIQSPDGSMVIYRIPDLPTLKTMVLDDPQVRDLKHITVDGKDYSRRELLYLMDSPAQYSPPQRYPKKWDLSHALMECVPFDYGYQVEKNRLKVELDLPGT